MTMSPRQILWVHTEAQFKFDIFCVHTNILGITYSGFRDYYEF